MIDWDEWRVSQKLGIRNQIWYADEPKIITGSETGTYGKNLNKEYMILGHYTTIHQNGNTSNRNMCCGADGRVALRTLANQITSRLTWNCLENLRILVGAEAYAHTRQQISKQSGKERFCNNTGDNLDAIRSAVVELFAKTHLVYWNNVEGQVHSKQMMRQPSRKRTRQPKEIPTRNWHLEGEIYLQTIQLGRGDSLLRCI